MSEHKMIKRSPGLAIKANFTKKSKKEKEELATIFCEGSQELKNLLLYMWENGINTFSCCAGHKRKTFEFNGKKVSEKFRQYIFFDVSSFSNHELKLLISAILIDKGSILNTFSYGIDNLGRSKSQRRSFTVHFNVNYKNNFVYLLELITKIKTGTLNQNKYISKISEMDKDYHNFLTSALKMHKYDLIASESTKVLKVLYLRDGLYIHISDGVKRIIRGKYNSSKLKAGLEMYCNKR